MDMLDSLRQAPSAESYCLYLTIDKMLDDPRRILEVRQWLRIGMIVKYIGDDPLGPPSEGTITEPRHTQAVVQDNLTRRRWAVLYAAILLDATAAPIQNDAPPLRPRPEEFLHWRHRGIPRQTSERACWHRRQAEL
jgi:hypothetical protein